LKQIWRMIDIICILSWRCQTYWTFLIDLLDPNNTLSQIITSVNVPNAKYEEVEFKFENLL
jgi:hypothetical protein